jgi:hypothetical protein
MSTADIIVGPARIFYAPVGTVLPADSLAYGAAWASPAAWVEIALTKTPVSMNRELATFQVMVEQSTLPVKRVATEETVAFETTLAELTGGYLALAMEGTNTPTAAGASQVGKEELLAGGEAFLSERTWAIEAMYVTSANVKFPIRLQIYRATAILNGQLTFGKADSAGIPLRIDALGDLTKTVGQQLFRFQKVLAAATG